MFLKTLALFATILGAVSATPTSAPTYDASFYYTDLGCPTPLSLKCDTNPFNLIPLKTTLKLEDYGVTVIASLSCEKELSQAQACLVPAYDGGIGIVISDSYGGPMCWSEFYIEEGIKRYKSSCRGPDFKIKVRVELPWDKMISYFVLSKSIVSHNPKIHVLFPNSHSMISRSSTIDLSEGMFLRVGL